MIKIITQVGLILVLSIILAGCQKDEEQKIRNQSILAGQKDNEVLLQDFTPDLEIALTNESAGNIPSTVYSGELSVDLDLDGMNDIKFHSFYGMGHPMGSIVPSQGCQISDISSKWNIEICSIPQQLLAKIDKNLEWHILSHEIVLSGYTPEWNNVPATISIFSWDEPNLYLAYRMIQSPDTIYGWMGIEIADYYKLKIKDTGLVK